MRHRRTIISAGLLLLALLLTVLPPIGEPPSSVTAAVVALLLIAVAGMAVAHSHVALRSPHRGPVEPWVKLGFVRRLRYLLTTGARQAVVAAVKQGWLTLSAPGVMRQGRKVRVEVAVTRDPEPSESMIARMRAVGQVSVVTIPTSAVMEVDLIGDTFVIIPLSSRRQLIASTAHWEFDVRPTSSGQQVLTVVGTRLVNVRGGEAEPVALPSFGKTVQVRVSIPYLASTLVRAHWQWVAGTFLGLGGAIGAWIALLHG